MKGQTKKITPVYTKPILHKEFFALQILAFRDITILQVEKILNPYDGNKEEILWFGKTTAGWMLMRQDDTFYFEENPCPTCLCAVSEEPHFQLPCCENLIHAQCFMQQLKSFKKGGFWRETHLQCPFCRQNYFEQKNGDKRAQWYYIDNHQLTMALEQIPGFSFNNFENNMLRLYNQFVAVRDALKEKDESVPEEERGGWAVIICDVCRGTHIAGKLSCAEEMDFDFSKPSLCDACEWGAKEAKDHRCFAHGKKFAVFKCDSCCNVATWDCFSNHYCERCHQQACTTKHYPCPGPDKCPLGMAHPKNSHGRHGEHDLGFVIGCFKCIDPNYEVNSSYSADAPDPFRLADLNNEENLGLFQYAPPPEPVKPVAEPIPDEEEENEIDLYNNFIAQFQEEEESSDKEEEKEEEEHIISPEENEIYEEFISQFQTSDVETCSSESDSSEISSVDEAPAFSEVEAQILPIITPRPMVHNDSALSENTLNLLHFNKGFDLFGEDDDEDEEVFPPPTTSPCPSTEVLVN